MAENPAADAPGVARIHRSDSTYPREMVLAAILLTVSDTPAPAGDVVERLRELGLDWGKSQPVWNCLHSLTKAGLLHADRAVDNGRRRGRRLYELSPAGAGVLEARLEDLGALRWKLAKWCDEYAALPSRSPVTGDADSL